MKKNGIKAVGIFNLIFFLFMTVLSLYFILYVSQYAFEISYLPDKLNTFFGEKLYPYLDYIPNKLSDIIPEYKTYIMILFCLSSMYFALCALGFLYSVKSISFSTLDDYAFLDQRKMVKKSMLIIFEFAIIMLIPTIFMIIDFGFTTVAKLHLSVSVVELLMYFIYYINYNKISSKYVK